LLIKKVIDININKIQVYFIQHILALSKVKV